MIMGDKLEMVWQVIRYEAQDNERCGASYCHLSIVVILCLTRASSYPTTWRLNSRVW